MPVQQMCYLSRLKAQGPALELPKLEHWPHDYVYLDLNLEIKECRCLQ